MIRVIALALGAGGLIGYAILRVTVQHRPVLPSAIGAVLGLVVLGLLARKPR